MRRILKFASVLGLVGTIAPALLFLNDDLGLPATKTWMLAATVLWFATVPFWMGRRRAD